MTLPVPHPDLRACVVVPARNEEDLIVGCLRALAMQEGISPLEYEVLLVLDKCDDATGARAREFAGQNPSLRLHLLDGPGKGSGHARRAGMDAACKRLLGLGRADGLVASTDADTVVAPDWLASQLEAAARGSRAIGGRISLSDDGTLPDHIARWHAERGRRRREALLARPDNPGVTEHWQFSGASMSLTAKTYREVGGLEPVTALEDEALEGVLRRRGIPIDRLLSVRVTTSARLVGRAEKGLAHDLAEVAAKLGPAD